MKNKVFLVFLCLMSLVLIILVIRDERINDEVTNSRKVDEISDLLDAYDVIVVGGEPEGVSAAVSAARNGAKTLLIEEREDLGGLFTYGMLNFLDIPQGKDQYSVSQGIFAEWHELVGGMSTFGIEEAKKAFSKLVNQEENLTLITNTKVIDVQVDSGVVSDIILSKENEEISLSASRFIDATQDADFAVMANAPYFIGGEDIGVENKKMAVTLMLHLKNVDWNGVKQTATSEKFGYGEVTETAAWGFSDLHYDYEPVEENTRLRGLNLAKVDDEYYINALQIFDVDGLSDSSKQEAIEKGKRETEHILNYLRNNFPGFENAEIASYPEELYVRETRHIESEYQLKMSDVWTNKDHWDTIALGAYPVDIQAQTPNDYGYVLSNPQQYGIPLRSLVPKNYNNLLVVGRAAGFSSTAAGSARIVPTGMATAQAAGVISTYSIEEDMDYSMLISEEEHVEAIREILIEQNAYIPHFELAYPYQGEWYDESIQILIDYSLIFGRYDNDLKVDKEVNVNSFLNTMKHAISRTKNQLDNESTNLDELFDKMDQTYIQLYSEEPNLLTKEELINVVYEIFGEADVQNKLLLLKNKGVISEVLYEKLNEKDSESIITNKEMFATTASIINFVKHQHSEQ